MSYPEVWLRGPVEGIPPMLQPVAHALLQAKEELGSMLADFPDALLWERPAGVASVAFHVQHICGIMDRLITYAKGLPLNEQQLTYLSLEGQPEGNITVAQLLHCFNERLLVTLTYLKQVPEAELVEFRAVGRRKLPSTVSGLLFHTAEHTQRHIGQLWVTVKVVLNSQRP